MDHLTRFQTEYAVEYVKINSDGALTTDQKRAFAEALSSCDDSDSVADCAERFFRGNKQKGSIVIFPRDTEIFGRIQSYTAFVRRLMQEMSLSKNDVDDFLASLKALELEDRLLEIRNAIGSVLMSAYLIWAFRNPDSPEDPFAGLVLADLPCRMGLDTSSVGADDRFVGWGISVTHTASVTNPTAFDPGLQHLSRWRSGGLTQPGPECSHIYRDGLPEVVIEPINFGRVASDFLEIVRS